MQIVERGTCLCKRLVFRAHSRTRLSRGVGVSGWGGDVSTSLHLRPRCTMCVLGCWGWGGDVSTSLHLRPRCTTCVLGCWGWGGDVSTSLHLRPRCTMCVFWGVRVGVGMSTSLHLRPRCTMCVLGCWGWGGDVSTSLHLRPRCTMCLNRCKAFDQLKSTCVLITDSAPVYPGISKTYGIKHFACAAFSIWRSATRTRWSTAMREASTAVGNCARVRSLRDCLQRRQWTWWSMHAFGNGGGTTVRLLWRWPWAKSWQTFERRSSRAKKTLLDVAPSILMSKLVTNFRTHMAGWRKIKLRKMLISLQWQPHVWNRKTHADQ